MTVSVKHQQTEGVQISSTLCTAAFRGRCDTELAGNMGKQMRRVVVRNLREGLPQGQNALRQRTAPEINVCCHGQDAGAEVGHHVRFALHSDECA